MNELRDNTVVTHINHFVADVAKNTAKSHAYTLDSKYLDQAEQYYSVQNQPAH